MAPQIAPLAVILFLIGGGFIINAENIPIAFAWLKEVPLGFGCLLGSVEVFICC